MVQSGLCNSETNTQDPRSQWRVRSVWGCLSLRSQWGYPRSADKRWCPDLQRSSSTRPLRVKTRFYLKGSWTRMLQMKYHLKLLRKSLLCIFHVRKTRNNHVILNCTSESCASDQLYDKQHTSVLSDKETLLITSYFPQRPWQIHVCIFWAIISQ